MRGFLFLVAVDPDIEEKGVKIVKKDCRYWFNGIAL